MGWLGVYRPEISRHIEINLTPPEATMSLVETRYEPIVLDDAAVPLITGTRMKVIELVLEQAAYGWSAEELCFQHPYLSLGQVHSPLAYY